jgi:1-acyl-sn-glycerol-3-phosphate acyltransferase
MLGRYLPAPVVGTLAFLTFVLNILVHIPFLMATAIVRILVPVPAVVRACRRAAESVGESWIGVNVLGLKMAGEIAWEVTGPGSLRRDATYLITANHRSAVDILVVQWLLNRRAPLVKFFLKRELFWVPLMGLAWWALEFPFMRRYPRAVLEQRPDLRRKDLETTRRLCERFGDMPVSILNFLEGTRFSPAKRDRQGSPYRHLLLPRAGGIAQVVSTLGDRIDALLDFTIVYPAGTPTFWDLISGQIPAITVHIDKVALNPAWAGRDYDDVGFREDFQAFVNELWAQKDERIEAMTNTRSARPSEALGARR